MRGVQRYRPQVIDILTDGCMHFLPVEEGHDALFSATDVDVLGFGCWGLLFAARVALFLDRGSETADLRVGEEVTDKGAGAPGRRWALGLGRRVVGDVCIDIDIVIDIGIGVGITSVDGLCCHMPTDRVDCFDPVAHLSLLASESRLDWMGRSDSKLLERGLSEWNML